MSKQLESTEGLRSHVQHNLNVCCQRLSMMIVKKMNYEMNKIDQILHSEWLGSREMRNCTDEATSRTVGRWAAQRNTKQQTGRSKISRVEVQVLCP